MRIVALEEHFAIPSLVRRIDPDAIAELGFPAGFGGNLEKQTSDLGAHRAAADELERTVRDLGFCG